MAKKEGEDSLSGSQTEKTSRRTFFSPDPTKREHGRIAGRGKEERKGEKVIPIRKGGGKGGRKVFSGKLEIKKVLPKSRMSCE